MLNMPILFARFSCACIFIARIVGQGEGITVCIGKKIWTNFQAP